MSAVRKKIITLVEAACTAGARQSKACESIGISAKTYQRWCRPDNAQDGRLDAKHKPGNKLTELERQRLITLANETKYVDLPPSKIVPELADKGIYLASESTFYRVLKAAKQLKHRQKARPSVPQKKPMALTATGPNQVYSWDITYLPTAVKGIFLYLYLVMDIYSRKIVGWQVHEAESSAFAAELMTDICRHEGILPEQVTLHSDNGSPMKGATLLATLQHLGITPSFSRPSVSNDNPYSESLFRTMKYIPEYPGRPFTGLPEARHWVQRFVDWYNQEHLHSAINFVTPEQRHKGLDIKILANRKRVYELAKSKHPERWSGSIRNWEPVGDVYLNPVKKLAVTERNKAA